MNRKLYAPLPAAAISGISSIGSLAFFGLTAWLTIISGGLFLASIVAIFLILYFDNNPPPLPIALLDAATKLDSAKNEHMRAYAQCESKHAVANTIQGLINQIDIAFAAFDLEKNPDEKIEKAQKVIEIGDQILTALPATTKENFALIREITAHVTEKKKIPTLYITHVASSDSAQELHTEANAVMT